MKLFASDYDGTYCKHTRLGRRELKVNIKKTKQWQQAGHLFIFATGRPISLMVMERRLHGLVYDYLVGLNGAVVVSKDGEVIFRQTIKQDIAQQIMELIKKENIKQYMITDGLNGHFYSYYHPLKLDYYLYKSLKYLFRMFNLTLEEALRHPVAQIAVKTNNHQEALRFATLVNEKYGEEVIAYANLVHVDICAKNLSKASGIEEVAIRHGILKDQIYCMGDSFNDLPMLQAYHGFTTVEAVEEIKVQTEGIFETVGEALDSIQ